MCPRRPRSLLEGCVMRPALYNTRECVLLWCCGRGARVEQHRKARTHPGIGLAMPPARVEARTGRSTGSRPPPGKHVGDWRPAALMSVASTRQHLEVATSSSGSRLRAAVGSTGTRSVRYLSTGWQWGQCAAHGRWAARQDFRQHFPGLCTRSARGQRTTLHISRSSATEVSEM